MKTVLALRDIEQRFGGVTAVAGVSLEVQTSSLTGLIGPNGAGKTTLVNVAGGQIRPSAGSVHLQGKEITRLPAHRRFELGLARTFQSLRLFGGLSAFENLCAGVLDGSDSGAGIRARAQCLLRTLGLEDDRDCVPGDLPFGKQKLVAIGRVLIARPAVVLMDEPFAGLTDEEIGSLSELLKMMASDGAAVLVIEHNLDALSSIAQQMFVLDHGRLIAQGLPAKVLELQEVREAYFGGHRKQEVESALGEA